MRYRRAMNADELRALQAPIKDRYRQDATAGVVTLSSRGVLGEESISCKVDTGKAIIEAGLHPASGGTGLMACSGNMLLDALVACAGVTLNAVATALGIAVRSGVVSADGDLDFRGTLGVAKDAPVGFKNIRLQFDLDTDAPPEQLAKLIQLTERYCVVYQTLRGDPELSVAHHVTAPAA
jgi:uncharacterized OsmC-like protein